MDSEKLQILAFTFAIVGISNWLFGGVSWRGQILNLRNTHPWIAMRWIGIGLLGAFAVIGSSAEITREIVGLIGSALVILGSARTRKNVRTARFSSETTV